MRLAILIALAAGIVAIFAATILLAVHGERWGATSSFGSAQHTKTFSRMVAKGVRYRDFQTLGVDRLSFGTCRVEKRRNGAISFGGFNVLVVDDLVLNLTDIPLQPVDISIAKANVKPTGKADFSELFLGIKNWAGGRFSGVSINRLMVNRYVSNVTTRVFTAERAESRFGQEGLLLHQCHVLLPNGTNAAVEKAQLVFRPFPSLVYAQGNEERHVPLTEAALSVMR